MKVRMTIDVDATTRFVVAKYFAVVGDHADKTRTRATRSQVKRFVVAALRQAVRDQASALRGRSKAAARRLAKGQAADPEPLREPNEKQQTLTW